MTGHPLRIREVHVYQVDLPLAKSYTMSEARTRCSTLLEVLRVGGRYAVAGAIGGPLVELDLRTVYLKDLTLFGCTYQPDEVFDNLIGYVERQEIRPVIAKTYPLDAIAQAQTDFLSKSHTGKLLLIPPRA